MPLFFASVPAVQSARVCMALSRGYPMEGGCFQRGVMVPTSMKVVAILYGRQDVFVTWDRAG